MSKIIELTQVEKNLVAAADGECTCGPYVSMFSFSEIPPFSPSSVVANIGTCIWICCAQMRFESFEYKDAKSGQLTKGMCGDTMAKAPNERQFGNTMAYIGALGALGSP